MMATQQTPSLCLTPVLSREEAWGRKTRPQPTELGLCEEAREGG